MIHKYIETNCTAIEINIMFVSEDIFSDFTAEQCVDLNFFMCFIITKVEKY